MPEFLIFEWMVFGGLIGLVGRIGDVIDLQTQAQTVVDTAVEGVADLEVSDVLTDHIAHALEVP